MVATNHENKRSEETDGDLRKPGGQSELSAMADAS